MKEKAEDIELNAYLSTKLKKALELDGDPVAVHISSDYPKVIKKSKSKTTICQSVQSARAGLPSYCSSSNIICNGRAHIGIGNSPRWDLEDFLVRQEKLVNSKTAARRMLHSANVQSSSLGKYLILSPLGKASFHPQVIIFVGTPFQISRILFLDAFTTGEINTVHREPFCSGVIATPITTKNIGVSFLDMSCRSFAKFKPEEMSIGVPYQKISKIVDNIDQSIAGSAEPGFLLRLLPKMMNLIK